MGTNRGRYFLLTGQTLSAAEAKEIGLVSEILPRTELMPRAWALACETMNRPALRRRYARVLLTADIKRRLHDLLGHGLALQGLAATQGGEGGAAR
jgi:enoyl-CoA hydratase/carnithine racemase